MKKTEASISINRKNGKITNIAVNIPIWNKLEEGLIKISIPLLGINTVAIDEKDAEKTIDEVIALFCITSEQFGKGIEEELKFLKWKVNKINKNETIAEFFIDEIDEILERILQTGDNYLNEHLDLQYA